MIDVKEKEKWLNEMLEEYPELKYDTLKRYYIEQMIDCYQANPKMFKECVNNSKKMKIEPKKLPDEIVCISKVSAEEAKYIDGAVKDKEVHVSDNGIIKVV